MSSLAGIIVVIGGLWIVVAGTSQAVHARQEAEIAPEDAPGNAPLEVTIRPRRSPLRGGFMQDGVLATDDGLYFLYTGWYIDRLGDRLAPGSLADRALRMGLGDVVLEILGELPVRDPVFIKDIGLILGGRHRGMSLLQVAGAFDVDLGPTPFPRGGFYGGVNLQAPWSMADQFIGPVDFSGAAR